jgi:exodeoxyribonuclease V gamma subunit
VVFATHQVPELDFESFSLSPLLRFDWLQRLLCSLDATSSRSQIGAALQAAADQLHRSGLLPMAEFGLRARDELVASTLPMLQVWCTRVQLHPQPLPVRALQFICHGITLQDRLALWQRSGQQRSGQQRSGQLAQDTQWRHVEPRNLCVKGTDNIRADVLLPAWVQAALASANGIHAPGIWVGIDAAITIAPMQPEQAQQTLQLLLSVFAQGQCQALPWACLTALAKLREGDTVAQEIYEGSGFQRGEVLEPCLARHYPDYASLSANPELNALADSVFGMLQSWLDTGVELVLHGAGDGAADSCVSDSFPG